MLNSIRVKILELKWEKNNIWKVINFSFTLAVSSLVYVGLMYIFGIYFCAADRSQVSAVSVYRK